MKLKFLSTIFLLCLVLIIPVSAGIIDEINPNYEEQSQEIQVEVILTGDEEGAKASEYPRDFIILIDNSMSMREKYDNKARLEWAKEATLGFLQSLYSYESRVGVITFSDKSEEISPLTYNFEDVKKNLDLISTSGFLSDYGLGISKAVYTLDQRDRDSIPYIIIITDGGDYGEIATVESTVENAKNEGIIINCIGIGERESIDEVILRNTIAESTGGDYRFVAPTELDHTITDIINTDAFLSAANIEIAIGQSDEAIIDSMSIPTRPLVTSGVAITSKDPVTYICPTLSNGEEIVLTFVALTPIKGQDITAGLIELKYTNENGQEIVKQFPITISIPGESLPWVYIILIVILILVIIGIIIIQKRDKKHFEEMVEELSTNEEKLRKMKRKIGNVIEQLNTTILKVKTLSFNTEEEVQQWKAKSRREFIDSLIEVVNNLEEINKLK